jgi:hypothetical protein
VEGSFINYKSEESEEGSVYSLNDFELLIKGIPFEESIFNLYNYPKEKLRKIKKIEISYTNAQRINLKPLKICEHLEELKIIFTNISEIELSPLENLPIKS